MDMQGMELGWYREQANAGGTVWNSKLEMSVCGLDSKLSMSILNLDLGFDRYS